MRESETRSTRAANAQQTRSKRAANAKWVLAEKNSRGTLERILECHFTEWFHHFWHTHSYIYEQSVHRMTFSRLSTTTEPSVLDERSCENYLSLSRLVSSRLAHSWHTHSYIYEQSGHRMSFSRLSTTTEPSVLDERSCTNYESLSRLVSSLLAHSLVFLQCRWRKWCVLDERSCTRVRAKWISEVIFSIEIITVETLTRKFTNKVDLGALGPRS